MYLSYAHPVRQALQFTIEIYGARRALLVVIGKDQFHRKTPGSPDVGSVGPDRHALLNRINAGSLQIPLSLHLDKTYPAGSGRMHTLQMAECGNIHARLAGRIQHGGTGSHIHFDIIYSKLYRIHLALPRYSD